ncbi:hypothetical protein IGI04_001498, partial [Brassica rapa subsp. trilocularis]
SIFTCLLALYVRGDNKQNDLRKWEENGTTEANPFVTLKARTNPMKLNGCINALYQLFHHHYQPTFDSLSRYPKGTSLLSFPPPPPPLLALSLYRDVSAAWLGCTKKQLGVNRGVYSIKRKKIASTSL